MQVLDARNVIQSKQDIMELLAETTTRTIFNAVASLNEKSNILISELRITNKQFYSRMSVLKKAGLIEKHNGKYFVTSFGKVLYTAQLQFKAQIDNAAEHFYKLKAVDEILAEKNINKEEMDRILDLLLDKKTKALLMV